MFPETAEWVTSKLGISSRGFVSKEETIIDLCLAAVGEAIRSSGISSEMLDGIIVATSTPEYINPSTAAIIHGAIGAKEECAALDIQGVCAGFIYALGIAASLGSCGAGQYFLVIGMDQFSQITDFESRDSVFFAFATPVAGIEEQLIHPNKFWGIPIYSTWIFRKKNPSRFVTKQIKSIQGPFLFHAIDFLDYSNEKSSIPALRIQPDERFRIIRDILVGLKARDF